MCSVKNTVCEIPQVHTTLCVQVPSFLNKGRRGASRLSTYEESQKYYNSNAICNHGIPSE